MCHMGNRHWLWQIEFHLCSLNIVISFNLMGKIRHKIDYNILLQLSNKNSLHSLSGAGSANFDQFILPRIDNMKIYR